MRIMEQVVCPLVLHDFQRSNSNILKLPNFSIAPSLLRVSVVHGVGGGELSITLMLVLFAQHIDQLLLLTATRKNQR